MIFKGKVAEPDRVTEHVYDPTTERVIAEIKGGVFETEDTKVIDRLKALGYESIDEPSREPDGDELTKESIARAVEDGTTDSIKVKDLIAFAEENQIDLGDARKKDDIITAILESK
jgi:hypothetical protein